MLINTLLLILGFILLIKGADIFVDSSVGIAKRLRIPTVIIGLTIVSIGTSAPEAVVSITASVQGENGIAIGNIVGSNIFNLLFVVGLCALIKPFAVQLKDIAKDFWISIGAAVVLMLIMILCADTVPRYVSALMLLLFFGYMFILIRQALKNKTPELSETEKAAKKEKPLWLSIILAVAGCGIIILGGQITVDSAVKIAEFFEIDKRIVGLTVVAVGTSLPELMTSLVAAKKGETGIALGNVIGSNIFNILFILGVAGVITPLAIDMNMVFDLSVLVGVSLVSLLFVYTGRKLVRYEGLSMVAMYAAYTVFIILK